MQRPMIARGLKMLGLLLFVLVMPVGLSAQDNKIEKFDVQAGQLSQGDLEKSRQAASAASLSPAGRPYRSQTETAELVKSYAVFYRSACCPQWKMTDRSCPCYAAQIGMLTFLVYVGYDRGEVDELMVNGGAGATLPDGTAVDLKPEFSKWLASVWIPENPSAFTPEPARYMSLSFRVRGVDHDFGWDHGWTASIREAPTEGGLYLMIAIAGLLVLGAFIGGALLLRRGGKEASVAAAATELDAGDPNRKRIEDEIRAMGDDD